MITSTININLVNLLEYLIFLSNGSLICGILDTNENCYGNKDGTEFINLILWQLVIDKFDYLAFSPERLEYPNIEHTKLHSQFTNDDDDNNKAINETTTINKFNNRKKYRLPDEFLYWDLSVCYSLYSLCSLQTNHYKSHRANEYINANTGSPKTKICPSNLLQKNKNISVIANDSAIFISCQFIVLHFAWNQFLNI